MLVTDKGHTDSGCDIQTMWLICERHWISSAVDSGQVDNLFSAKPTRGSMHAVDP